MNKLKVAPNQKVVTVHKVHGKSGRILDISANKEAMKQLSTDVYVLYMHFILSVPEYTEALSLQHISETTSLRERTYYKAINELIEKGYLVKEPHENFKDHYGFYESPNMYIYHQLTVDEYIAKFLVPGAEVPSGTTLLELSKEVIDPPEEYEPMIEAKIHTLTYDEFLQTLYWRAIAAFKRKQMGYKCELCGSSNKLNVHHRTYIIHGIEHYSGVIEKDMMLVCEKCHREIHEEYGDITPQND